MNNIDAYNLNKSKPKKVCPEGKILNPLTNRCIKIKPDKIKKSKPKKVCPEGKVLNLLTNRCIKIKPDKIKKTLKNYDEYGNIIKKSKPKKVCPEGKILNPLTNRCIKIKPDKVKKSKNEMTLKSQSNLILKLSTKPKSISKKFFIEDVIKEESITPEFIELTRNSSSLKKSKANVIINFLKDKLINNKYTLDNRMKFAKYLKNCLKNIKSTDCLEYKKFGNNAGFTINNIVNLVKKIGTESVYGAIYLSSIKDCIGGFSIVSKVMAASSGNLKEVSLMNKITEDLLIPKKTKHFAAVYKHAVCKNNKIISLNGDTMAMPTKLKLVSINELAHGDLKTLVSDRDIVSNDELLYNIMFQVFISIGTFHNTVKYIHQDAHYGNFLYQKNNETGYYHYVFDKKDYYLKACGYNIMIYDFGLSYDISKNPPNKFELRAFHDYSRIVHAFISEGLGGWISLIGLPKHQTDLKISNIRSILFELTNEYIKKNIYKTPKQLFDDILKQIFIPFSPANMFMTTRPNNIINDKPYIIG
jgi:hypothetical protein